VQRSERLASPTLKGLLQRGARFAPEYRDGLSNHLPMALIALAGLGARSARLESFFDQYAMRLEPAISARKSPPQAAPRLGDIDCYPEALALMKERVLRDGRETVLRQELERLAPGIGAAAFHGMLRTAYGIEAQSDDEVAAGLAYWGSRYLPIGAPVQQSGTTPLHAWLENIQKSTSHLSFDLPLIHHSMSAMAKTSEWQQALPGLDISTLSIDALAQIAATSYLKEANFIVLHLITSAHAMHTLLPYADDPRTLLWYYTLAYAAALPFTPLIDETRPDLDGPDMSSAIELALASDNDHVAKLVYSCYSLAACCAPSNEGDATLFAAVARSAAG
jgi:hypothetical protein